MHKTDKHKTVGSCCIAQGALLCALWWPTGQGCRGGRSKREELYVNIELIHFLVQQKLTQHYKATDLGRDQSREHIKSQRHYFDNKGPSSQSYAFSSSHVSIWELDYKKSWAPKNWWFWIVVLEKTLESPLDCKEIQPVHPKGNKSWIFIARADAEAEAPILWLPDTKKWLIWKDPDAGKDWRWREKEMTEDANQLLHIVGWHHQVNGHEFEVSSGSSWWTSLVAQMVKW